MIIRWVIGPWMAVLLAMAHVVPVTAQIPQLPQAPQVPQLPSNLPIGAPAAPVITSPEGGDSVHSPIVVTGTAAKGTKVKVTATFALAVSLPVSTPSTKIGNAETAADDAGHWQVSIAYTVPVKASGTKIVLEAVAVNTLTGQASAATKIEVTPKT
jgi:hypothetical protein